MNEYEWLTKGLLISKPFFILDVKHLILLG